MPLSSAAPIWRRLAALGYDSLLLGSLIFVITGALIWLYGISDLPMAELNGVEHPPAWFSQLVIFPVMLLVTISFYHFFWRRGGQTLGMRAWRIRTERFDGRPMKLWQTVVRCSAGIITFGMGHLFALFNGHRQSLQDVLSQTRTVLLPKN